MGKMKKPKRTVWHELYKVFIRFVILLGATVLISVLYKGFIKIGFFQLIRKAPARRLIFCSLELLLLGIYWHYLFMFSQKCRHRSRSMRVYYIRTLVVFAAFCAVYWLSNLYLNREVNSWIFRVTYNLICFRLKTNAPDNLVPYMTAYLVVTLMIMMLEPVIARMRHIEWKEMSRTLKRKILRNRLSRR